MTDETLELIRFLALVLIWGVLFALIFTWVFGG